MLIAIAGDSADGDQHISLIKVTFQGLGHSHAPFEMVDLVIAAGFGQDRQMLQGPDFELNIGEFHVTHNTLWGFS